MDEEQFTKKYGTLYEGLQLDMEENKRKSALLFPSLFIVRRLAFTAVVVWLDWFVWAQIAMQFASCVIMLIYFGHVWPFETHVITKLEMFNEVTTICLGYMMLCFTDWVGRAATRYMVGWVFIAVVCLHLLAHLIMLVRNTFMEFKSKRRSKAY